MRWVVSLLLSPLGMWPQVNKIHNFELTLPKENFEVNYSSLALYHKNPKKSTKINSKFISLLELTQILIKVNYSSPINVKN